MKLTTVPNVAPGRERVIELLRKVADRLEADEDETDEGVSAAVIILVTRIDGGEEFSWRRSKVGLNSMEMYGIMASGMTV